MALLINIPDRPVTKIVDKLAEFIGRDEIYVWPEVANPDDITFALVWKHKTGSLLPYKNLQAISSFGAGVDSILADKELPNVPICRIVDPNLSQQMAMFVLTVIQQHKLRFGQFDAQQKQQIWKPKSQHKKRTVGILGLGQLGRQCAKLLLNVGFDVQGWSRTEKDLQGVKCYTGLNGLNDMLATTDYLVNLLPLTEDTKGILNTDLFNKLPAASVLVNVARGEHLVEDDLIQAINSGQIEHAFLDVFTQEPLPKEHCFWQQPQITVTPHISAVTDIDTAVTQISENYLAIKHQRKLKNVIDLNLGY